MYKYNSRIDSRIKYIKTQTEPRRSPTFLWHAVLKLYTKNSIGMHAQWNQRNFECVEPTKDLATSGQYSLSNIHCSRSDHVKVPQPAGALHT